MSRWVYLAVILSILVIFAIPLLIFFAVPAPLPQYHGNVTVNVTFWIPITPFPF